MVEVLTALIHTPEITLHKLDISGNDISTKGWKALITLLASPTCAQLEELSVDDSELSSKQALILAKSLRQLSSLRVLSLCHCELQSAGAIAVATVVTSLPSFKHLKVDGNSIAEAGLDRLTALFRGSDATLDGKLY